MRLFTAIRRLIAETVLLIAAEARRIGRRKMLLASVAIAAIAAIWIVQASADVALQAHVSNIVRRKRWGAEGER